MNPPTEDDTQRAQFEKLGISRVRQLVLEWSGPLQALANQWLHDKDQESDRLRLASKAEQAALARAAAAYAKRSVKAALISNIIATAALVIATI